MFCFSSGSMMNWPSAIIYLMRNVRSLIVITIALPLPLLWTILFLQSQTKTQYCLCNYNSAWVERLECQLLIKKKKISPCGVYANFWNCRIPTPPSPDEPAPAHSNSRSITIFYFISQRNRSLRSQTKS